MKETVSRLNLGTCLSLVLIRPDSLKLWSISTTNRCSFLSRYSRVAIMFFLRGNPLKKRFMSFFWKEWIDSFEKPSKNLVINWDVSGLTGVGD